MEVATKNKALTDTLPENLIPAFISKSISLTQEDRKFLESIEGDGPYNQSNDLWGSLSYTCQQNLLWHMLQAGA